MLGTELGLSKDVMIKVSFHFYRVNAALHKYIMQGSFPPCNQRPFFPLERAGREVAARKTKLRRITLRI